MCGWELWVFPPPNIDHTRNIRSLNLKAFADPQTDAPWKTSVVDVSAEVLCVSQFTLYAKIVKNKPDFHKAMAWLASSLSFDLTVGLGRRLI